MLRKVLVIFSILVLFTSNSLHATDNSFALQYKLKNHWVAKQQLKDLRLAIAYFKTVNSPIQAVCSNKDVFCKQRVDILNMVLTKQKTKQIIKSTIFSDKLSKNELILQKYNKIYFDKNKYSELFINYVSVNETTPVTKSINDVKTLLKKSNRKYLSNFILYCNKINTTCKKRLNYLTTKIKQLPFKYNIKTKIDKSLNDKQTKLINYRYNYDYTKAVKKQVVKKIIKANPKKNIKTIIKKIAKIDSMNDKNIIAFAENSFELILTEQKKVDNLIQNSLLNRFNFVCSGKPSLCKQRVRIIKEHALKNTYNIIELYQIEGSTNENFIKITHKN